MPDPSVVAAVRKALRDGNLSYVEVQDIIRSTFDYGGITEQEHRDLRTVLVLGQRLMEERARAALEHFVAHLDKQPKAGGTIRVPKIDPGRFSARNTNLGKFSHGNFDVEYLPASGTIYVSLKVEYRFEEGIGEAQQLSFKQRFKQAVETWSKCRVFLVTTDFSFHPSIDFRFGLFESPNCHFPVDVETNDRREWVGNDLNVCINTDTKTLIHELGHVYGNYDEYYGSGFLAFIERRMYWHDNNHERDDKALMHSGNEFRARYFDHFENWVNRHFRQYGVVYRAVRKVS